MERHVRIAMIFEDRAGWNVLVLRLLVAAVLVGPVAVARPLRDATS